MPTKIYKSFLDKIDQNSYENAVKLVIQSKDKILKEISYLLDQDAEFAILTEKQKKMIKKFLKWYLNDFLIEYPNQEIIRKIYNISKNLYKTGISDIFILNLYNKFIGILNSMNVASQILYHRVDRDLLAILRPYTILSLEIEKKIDGLTNIESTEFDGVGVVETIKKAKREHINIKNKVIKAILDDEEISDIKDAKSCEFYKILSKINTKMLDKEFSQIDKIHREFHDYVIYYKKNKNKLSSSQKYILIKELESISLKILYMLNELHVELSNRFSFMDMLTKSYNKNVFSIIFQREVSRAKRYGFPLSIVVIDIDNFKHINDTYGHLVGDEVLKELSSLLRKHIRQSDYLFRFGGEEFIILLPHTDAKNAMVAAEKIRKKVEASIFTSNNIKLTISCGISELKNFDNPYIDLEEADRMLYISKNSGKNRCAVAGVSI